MNEELFLMPIYIPETIWAVSSRLEGFRAQRQQWPWGVRQRHRELVPDLIDGAARRRYAQTPPQRAGH